MGSRIRIAAAACLVASGLFAGGAGGAIAFAGPDPSSETSDDGQVGDPAGSAIRDVQGSVGVQPGPQWNPRNPGTAGDGSGAPLPRVGNGRVEGEGPDGRRHDGEQPDPGDNGTVEGGAETRPEQQPPGGEDGGKPPGGEGTPPGGEGGGKPPGGEGTPPGGEGGEEPPGENNGGCNNDGSGNNGGGNNEGGCGGGGEENPPGGGDCDNEGGEKSGRGDGEGGCGGGGEENPPGEHPHCPWWRCDEDPEEPPASGGGGGGGFGGVDELPSGRPASPPEMQLPPELQAALTAAAAAAAAPSAVAGAAGSSGAAATGLVGAAAAAIPLAPITLPVIVLPPAGTDADAGPPAAPPAPVTPQEPQTVIAAPPARHEPPATGAGFNAFPPPSYRAGYAEYLRTAGLSQIAALAVPGVAGLLVLTGAGGFIGYRQAKAGHTVHPNAGIARFMTPS